MKPEEVESLFHHLPPVTPSPGLRERVLRQAREETALSSFRPPEVPSNPRTHFLLRFWGSVPLAASLIAILAIVVTIITGIPPSRPKLLTPAAPPSGQETPVERLIEELGAEDPQARARAFRNLLDQGESVRPALEKALSHRDAEVRGRARELLVHLDRDPKLKKILEHSGPLGDGSAFWIDSGGFDFVSDPKYLPDWMTPTLIDSAKFVVALVDLDGTNIKRSQLVEVRCKTLVVERGLKQTFPPYAQAFIDGGRTGHTTGAVEPNHKDMNARFQRMEEPRGPGFFRLWSRGRTQLAFVATSTDRVPWTNLLYPVLCKEASSGENPTRRAAALHALRHWFYPESVEIAIQALEDPRQDVRDVAQSTLRWIVRVPEKDPDAAVRWWRSVKAEERDSHFMKWRSEAMDGLYSEYRGTDPASPREKEKDR